jgi:amidophosphoribosyltransferase
VLGGRSIYEVRKQMGKELAREAPADVDVIIPVPDSGVPAAIGYAQESAIPFELGIIRNHYVGRTFIEPTQQIRALGVKLKHNANRHVIRGKRVLVASPPIAHPDFYGIDTPEERHLLAATHTLEEMRKFIGVTSLAFLSVDGIYRSVGLPGRDPARPQFTDHCFTGDYPTALTDREGPRQARQLSLLAEAR